MAIYFRILKPHELIAVSISGRMRFEDLCSVAIRLTNDPDFIRNYDRIIFLKQDADFSEMNLDIFSDLKDAMKKVFMKDIELDPSNFPAYRVAVVSSPSINQIMMQLFGAIWESDPDPVVAVERFAMVSDALKWLGQDTLPGSEFREELKGL